MGTPADQLQIPQQAPQSPLDQYMAQYGQQLQSMLAGDPSGGQPSGDPGMDAAGSVSNLGPDLYRPTLPEVPQSALAAPSGQGGAGSAQPQGPTPAGPPQGQGAPQSALADSPAARRAQNNDNPDAEKAAANGQPPTPGSSQDQYSFRDLVKEHPKQFDKQLDQLKDQLDKAGQSIDSAYATMMKQLGGRPTTDVSTKEKGMLLMEFGMRMMQHSASQYGQTNTTSGAFGQAGTETMQSAKGLIAQKQQQQQRYDQMQQQLTIAQGKEKAQLASRSALEEGRDARAYGQQNSMLDRVKLQQQGANDRNAATNQTRVDTNQNTVSGANDRNSARITAGNNAVTRTVTDDSGTVWGVTKTGQVSPLGKDGTPIKAAPGGASGAKQTAAQANYQLYMQTYGTGSDGKPLQGDDLKSAQGEALKYAANPRTYQLSDAQARQMSEKSADSFIRANPTSWMGMSQDDIQAKRDSYAESEYNRIRRGGSASPPAAPRSALTPDTVPGAPPAQPGAPGAPGPSAGRGNPPPTGGNTPTQPPPNSTKGPNSAQLGALQQNPQKIAPYFLQKFGYLPKEFQQYAQPRSALGQ